MRSNSRASTSSKKAMEPVKALLTQRSIGPSVRSTCSAAASTAVLSATSTETPSARRLAACTSRTVSSRRSCPRASAATSHPRVASSRAVARPIPAVPPVTDGDPWRPRALAVEHVLSSKWWSPDRVRAASAAAPRSRGRRRFRQGSGHGREEQGGAGGAPGADLPVLGDLLGEQVLPPAASIRLFASSRSGIHGCFSYLSAPPMPARTSHTLALAMPSVASGVCSIRYASPEASTRSAPSPGSDGSGTERRRPNW
jgi:hypothetical protein